jgi:hypothetical protein
LAPIIQIVTIHLGELQFRRTYTPVVNACGGQEARLRSNYQYAQTYVRPSFGAVPTLVFALAAWGAIFGISWVAWQLTDLLR